MGFFQRRQDGEEITRRIVEGLPDHLNDGGVFLALTMGTDRADRPFEHRVREWIGAGEKISILHSWLARSWILRSLRCVQTGKPSAVAKNPNAGARCFNSLQITAACLRFHLHPAKIGRPKNFYCPAPGLTIKLRSPWEWLLRWESAACNDGVEQLLLDSPLHASPQMEFVVRHRLDKGFWNPSSYTLRTEDPFNMECSAQPWMAHLISLCDGKATGREALKTLIQNEALPKSTPAGEFARAAASLVSGGFIEVEGFRLPRQQK